MGENEREYVPDWLEVENAEREQDFDDNRIPSECDDEEEEESEESYRIDFGDRDPSPFRSSILPRRRKPSPPPKKRNQQKRSMPTTQWDCKKCTYINLGGANLWDVRQFPGRHDC